ncbi:MAG: pyruvate ferredoxin oxidoreductase [Deltaproteobacteria bacterium]|nr:pyruvate ferredoxin oxidoreductase [Deltaproteobacteria bacterium]
MKEVLMGNHASSWGVKLAKVEVISAYPITPQTQVVEELSEMCASGGLKAKFIKVESEHSAMACLIGASQTGARTFTATSSQGLALMHELLFYAAYGRLPIVMTDVNRAMAPGWSIWSDQTDSLAQRDTGWLQLYCESNQEILDTILIAYKLAETIKLPVMVVYDAFFLSHTYEPVDIPEAKDVDLFLPPYKADFKIDPKNPRSFNELTPPNSYMEFRYIMEEAHHRAKKVYAEIAEEFFQKFGRRYNAVSAYKCEDAEIALVTSGSASGTARVVVDDLRARGEKVGLIKMKMFRPSPVESIRELMGNLNGSKIKKLAVFDRNISHGIGGIWASEIKSALCGIGTAPPVFSFIAGLGGRDIVPETIIEGYKFSKGLNRPEQNYYWLGVKA